MHECLADVVFDGEVSVYYLPDCPNCMTLKSALDAENIRYKSMMMETAESITDMRLGQCFAMQAPVLRVGDKFYEDLF